MTNTLPNTNAAATLAAIIARGQAAYVESLPDYARGPVADVEPTQCNLTLSDERQRELCLTCPLAECLDITSPRCPIRIEQRRLWRNRR